MYLIVVGVNRYRNETLRLKYAVPDGKALVASLEQTAPPLVEKMQVVALFDRCDAARFAPSARSWPGGCATSPKPGPMAKKQIEATLAGNTVQAANEEMYAYVGKDGTLRGLNTPKGTIGTWRVTDNNVLCAKWVQPTTQQEVCDSLRYTGGKSYEWNGNSLVVIKGNPKNL